MAEQEEKPTYKDTLLRAIAIIGLVAIIVLGAWGVIELTFNLPGFLGGIGGEFSSFFSHPAKQGPESVTVTLPQFVYTDEPFTAAWVHINPANQNYSYTLSYSCTNGLSIKAPTPTGTLVAVPCNTPFDYVSATSSMALVPSVVGTAQLSTTITVSAISLTDGSVTAVGTSSVVVLPPRNVKPVGTTTTTKPAPKTVTKKVILSSTRYTHLSGLPDLAVNIISLVPQGNNFYSVQFVIQNTGTNVMQQGWLFSAALPVGMPYTYYSQPQQALFPGDKIVYTLTFSTNTNTGYQYQNQYPYGYTYGTNTVTIIADPSNLRAESNKGNNTATAPLPLY